MHDTLPPLETVFGRQLPRLRGITCWEQIEPLGKANIERLVQLAQDTAHLGLAEGMAHDELKAIRAGIDFLRERLAETSTAKPLLPRLRSESFRKGEVVVVYLGDTPGSIAPAPWIPAIITDVEKSYRAEWADGTPNSGYYWRLTAIAATPFFPEQRSVAFSTSEPRVLPQDDFDYLTIRHPDDTAFRDLYSANACRSWHPLWCLERGTLSSGEEMDMKSWLSGVSGAIQSHD
jgi:hypothetical protein